MRERIEQALQRTWWAPKPTPLARALGPLAALYRALAWGHKALSQPVQVGLPVVVVGNLIVGGAGKTPTVMAVVQLLRAFGWVPGVVSRGYGRMGEDGRSIEVTRDTSASACGDEPLLIHLRTGAPVVVARDRVAAARALRQTHPQVTIIVSDDGLQHHRLARDAEVIVFDARGAGNGLLLPAGPLREPLRAAPNDASLVLYNAGAPTTPLPGWISRRSLAGLVPLAQWWQGQPAAHAAWQEVALRGVLAVAGIASPEPFFEMLRAHGLAIVPRPLPDHYDFAHLPWREDTGDVVLTEKDAVKLRPERLAGSVVRVWVAPLNFEPEVPFAAALKRQFPHPPAKS